MNAHRLLAHLLIPVLLSACAASAPKTVPGPDLPSPTAGGPTSSYPAPTQPDVVLVTPVSAATAYPAEQAPTEAPPALPPEAILIHEPGPASRIVSPLHVSGESNPTFEQSLQVLISGENNQTIAATSAQIQTEAGQRGPFSADVRFTTPNEQPGRITVSDISARDGGILHLNSVEVTLLASGAADLKSPLDLATEKIAIFSPSAGETVSGGSLEFSGYAGYVFEGVLNVKLCGEGGSGTPDPVCGTEDNIIAQGTIHLNSPDVGQPGPFNGALAYQISQPVQARLAVYSLSPRDGGLTHLNSVLVALAP